MKEEFRRGGGCPQLIDLIPNNNISMARDSKGGRDGFGVGEEKKLELRLGLPGEEEHFPTLEERREETSVLSLGYFSKISKGNNSSHSAGAKRGFLDTVEPKTRGFLQLNTSGGLDKDVAQKANGKACCPPPPPSHASATTASRNVAGSNSSSQTRTTSETIVGWPPIRSFRRNLASSSKPSLESQNVNSEKAMKLENSRKGLFVKINMDGIPIGRKVDLTAYDSYSKLSLAVDELFRGLLAAQKDPLAAGTQSAEEMQPITGLLDGSGEYTLVYEDDEGDRMLVGDVPWDMFVSTAKRLRVLKTSELSTISLDAGSRKRAATEC